MLDELFSPGTQIEPRLVESILFEPDGRCVELIIGLVGRVVVVAYVGIIGRSGK